MSWKKLFLILFLSIVWVSCSKWKYPDDNIIEEAVEDVIEEETGLCVDLTPSSPETK